jgi:hypothetical protein
MSRNLPQVLLHVKDVVGCTPYYALQGRTLKRKIQFPIGRKEAQDAQVKT